MPAYRLCLRTDKEPVAPREREARELGSNSLAGSPVSRVTFEPSRCMQVDVAQRRESGRRGRPLVRMKPSTTMTSTTIATTMIAVVTAAAARTMNSPIFSVLQIKKERQSDPSGVGKDSSWALPLPIITARSSALPGDFGERHPVSVPGLLRGRLSLRTHQSPAPPLARFRGQRSSQQSGEAALTTLTSSDPGDGVEITACFGAPDHRHAAQTVPAYERIVAAMS
jgi:hypothetical protein